MTDTTEMRMEAEKLKNLGNEEYVAGRFSSAIEYYTRAITLNSKEPKYYQNRAAAYFGLAQYDSSLADCERALALDPTFLKAVVRGAKCLAKLGRVDEAVARLLSVSVEDPLVQAIRLKTEGNAAWKREEYQAAAELYTQALDVLGDVDADERAKILCNRAGSYHKLGRFEEALRDADEAVALDSSFAKAHLRRAMALEGLGRHDEAGEEYGWLDRAGYFRRDAETGQGIDVGSFVEEWRRLCELARVNKRYVEAAALPRILKVLNDQNRFREATQCCERCLPVFQELRMCILEGAAYGSMSDAFLKLGQYEMAIECSEEQLVIARKVGSRDFEGYAFTNLYTAYDSLRQYRRVVGCLEEYLAFVIIEGDRAEEGRTYGSLGAAYNELGEFRKAIECHEKRLAIARELGDRAGEGRACGNLGSTYDAQGQYQQAIEYHELALGIAKELSDLADEGRTYGNLGVVYLSLGQFQRAIECHEKRLSIAREVGDRRHQGTAWGNLGNVFYALGQYKKAIEHHEMALAIAKEVGDRAGEGYAHGNMGIAYEALLRFQEAVDCCEAHLAIAVELDDRSGQSNAFGNLGNLYGFLGQYQKSVEYYEKQLAISREVGDHSGESIGLHNMSLAFLEQGDLQRSVGLAVQARDVRESLWDDLGTDETSKITLLEQLGKTYRLLQWAQVKAGHWPHESALETAERGRARTLVDRLSRSDATFPSEPLTASAMRSLAEKCGTVVVVYSVVDENKPQPPGTVFAELDEYVYTWVITPDAITFHRRHPARPLKDMAADVANVIRPSMYESSPTSVLTELYDLLIRPIVNLSDIDVITFVPQGPLLFVPFTALHDSETDLDLIDRCVVSISPCVAVLKRELVAAPGDQPRCLIVGDPTRDLNNFRAGALIISRLVAGSGGVEGRLLGDAATKEAVKDRLHPAPRHVLFACHGKAPQTHVAIARDGEEAVLMLSGGVLGEREMATIDLGTTALVDLIACWLAGGKTSVEGALNLVRACIVAGAQSVVGALSPVWDLPTAILMVRFYHRLVEMEGETDGRWRAARAFRDAQLWLRSSSCDEIVGYLTSLGDQYEPSRRLRRRVKMWFKVDERSGDFTSVSDGSKAESPDSFALPVIWSPFQVMGRY